MSDKVTINGKEYTERSISFIEINGTKTTDAMITPDMSKNGPKVSAIIKVDGSSFEKDTRDFIVQKEAKKALINNGKEEGSNQISVDDEKEAIQEKVSKNLVVRLIEKIKNIFISKNR